MDIVSNRDRFHILCVCTGNVYRSRIAADAFRGELRAQLGPSCDGFEVASAGTQAITGQPLERGQVAELLRLGVRVDVDVDVTRRLDAAEIARVDLVITAERVHRSVVLQLSPGALRRTFMLGELARIAGPAARRAGLASRDAKEDPAHRARAVIAAAAIDRGVVPLVGTDEIADPWGQPFSFLELVAAQVRDAAARTVEALIGDAGSDLDR